MNRKIFYAPSTIKALCEKLIGRLSEDEILDIEETLTRMAICAIEKKEICLRMSEFVHRNARTFFVSLEWDICENCDYYVIGGEVRELTITKDGRVKNEQLCKVGYLRTDEVK